MNNPKTLSDLCSWLKQNSSGGYRPSTEAAIVIEALAARAGVSMEASIFDSTFAPDRMTNQEPTAITNDRTPMLIIRDLRMLLYDLVRHAKAREIPGAAHLILAEDIIESADAFYDHQRAILQ